MLNSYNVFLSDGIDGKQARRTKSSGPLGELFDHGLDSWTASLVPICLYSCFSRVDHTINVWRFYFVLWNILISFYLSHWEKYNTGVLFLPWGYDFGMIVSTTTINGQFDIILHFIYTFFISEFCICLHSHGDIRSSYVESRLSFRTQFWFLFRTLNSCDFFRM